MKVYPFRSENGKAISNQYVIVDNNRYVFQSYDSIIAEIDFGQRVITLSDKWDFSRTTGKYRNKFFADYVFFNSLATKEGIAKALKGNVDKELSNWTIRW